MNKSKLIKKINPLYLKGIAHRGLHNDLYTENGLKAFKNAMDNNVPFEFDIHLTKDNELVVCHDEELKRTTGKEGIIEDLTLKEIKDNYRLLDGEEVPTLKEVLSLTKGNYPIVIELKVFRRNYKALAKKAREELAIYKANPNFFLISFDPRALIRMKKLKMIDGLLVCKSHEWVYNLKFLFDSIDIEDVMVKENKVKRYFKNHFINVWTIRDENNLNNVKDYSDTITFELIDPKLVINRK